MHLLVMIFMLYFGWKILMKSLKWIFVVGIIFHVSANVFDVSFIDMIKLFI
ncbi:MAG: hypothetical protein N4A40_13095 [Tissierellales bacterium]|jgi:hypothetical protein|nr:hypothetical protein [Tissierellales bacterium]